MTGYSWSTPAVDVGAVTVNGPEGQARNEDAAGWDSIDWRACEDQVRRLRQRIFKATRERTSTRNALAARLSRVPRRVARTVLRGPGRGNAPRLPDWRCLSCAVVLLHQRRIAYGASGKVAGSCPRRAHRTWERTAAAGRLVVQARFRAARNATRHGYRSSHDGGADHVTRGYARREDSAPDGVIGRVRPGR